MGEEIFIDFTLKGFNKPLKLKGEVAHATRMGIGVEFIDVNPHLAEMIGLVIEQMKG